MSKNLTKGGATMLENLFNYPTVLSRHRNAPLLQNRNRYLRHHAQQGCTQGTLLHIARELLPIVFRPDMPCEPLVTAQQVNTAAERWARQQCRRGCAHSFKWSHTLFVEVALARCAIPESATPTIEHWSNNAELVVFLTSL